MGNRLRVAGRLSASLSFAAAAFGTAVGLAVIAPRFSIGGPSLIDDWNAILSSPGQLRDLSEFLSPDGGRFRPGWTAWNYLQWHTTGAPANLLGPRFWGAGRLALLVVGLATFTALLLAGRRRTLGEPIYAALVGLPALLVVTVPAFGVDLARYGPQEPLLIGAMTLGGSLVFLGGRALVHGEQGIRRTPC